jgi:hypothetical protein
MGRIPEKNPRFRTKEQICADVAVVLNAPLSWGTQHAVIAEALWVWTEFDGKYDGCRVWSESAWASRSSKKELRHDHAIPKALLVEQLRLLRNKASVEDVREILDQNVGVVITKAEDAILTGCGLRSNLPVNEQFDPMSRYRVASINVVRPYDKTSDLNS